MYYITLLMCAYVCVLTHTNTFFKNDQINETQKQNFQSDFSQRKKTSLLGTLAICQWKFYI